MITDAVVSVWCVDICLEIMLLFSKCCH